MSVYGGSRANFNPTNDKLVTLGFSLCKERVLRTRKNLVKQILIAMTVAVASQATASELPESIARALTQTGLPASAVSIWVAPAQNPSAPVLSMNAQKPMQPASIIKVVTTGAALDLLKPNYYWNTDITAQAAPDRKTGTVRGVAIRGTGDPHLVVERLWMMTERLRGLGVRKIEGDITLDRTAFDVPDIDPAAFDGAGTRSYNVGPDALMVSLKTVSLSFIPEPNGKWATVIMTPKLEGVKFPQRVRLAKGSCGDWKTKLRANFKQPTNLQLKGKYPSACGNQMWHMTLWSPDDYFTRVFKYVLRKSGIAWTGKARAGVANRKDHLLLREYSEPLPQVVGWINKFSSNPMARQVFLTLSFADERESSRAIFEAAQSLDGIESGDGQSQLPGQEQVKDAKPRPASLERSRTVMEKWLVNAVGAAPGSVWMENGSGLSRKTRATAESIGRVLGYMYQSAVMPEFMASLPLAGIDGTMRKRPMHAGSAHIKTGYLANVRSIAGYVTDVNGKRWCVVVMINHDKPRHDRVLSQAVLDWTAQSAGQQSVLSVSHPEDMHLTVTGTSVEIF